MFRLDDVWDEAKKIIGACDDAKMLRWSGDAVSLVANKADLEGFKGFLDVCSSGCSCAATSSTCNNPAGCGRKCITLPREVETVIGVNIGGQPVAGYNMLFEFHLNGPGSLRTACEWKWADSGNFHCTYRDLQQPAQLVAYLQLDDDNGKQLIVHGYDRDGQLLRRQVSGQWVNGYQVPTIYGYAIPDANAPYIARITGIYKDRTAGTVRLSTTDDSGATGMTLGVYEPDETTPQYRRIQLNRSCNWARVAYLKTNPTFFSRFDHVPMKSRVAFLLAMQARKHYSDVAIGEAHSYEADAARLEIEAQQKAEPPVLMPIQVLDQSMPRDKYDYDIR